MADRYGQMDAAGTQIVTVALADQATATERGWLGPIPANVGPGWTTSNGGQTWTAGTLPVPPEQANQQTLQQRAQNALTANANFLAIASPSNAQNAAQVQALTKECNGIIRLLLNLLDSTAGT